MVKRKRYTQEFKEQMVLELLSKQSTAAQIAQREGITPQTLNSWKKKITSGKFESENETELRLRKRIAELEGALAESALNVHILKKTEIYLKEMQRKERLSSAISPLNSE